MSAAGRSAAPEHAASPQQRLTWWRTQLLRVLLWLDTRPGAIEGVAADRIERIDIPTTL